MGLLTPPPFAMNFLLLVRLNFAAMVPGLGDRGKNLKCLSDFPLLEKGPDLRMTKNSRKSVGLENFTAWRGAPAFFFYFIRPQIINGRLLSGLLYIVYDFTPSQ